MLTMINEYTFEQQPNDEKHKTIICGNANTIQ